MATKRAVNIAPARLNKRPSGNRAITTSKTSLRRSYNAMRYQRNAVVRQRDAALAIVYALSLVSACANCGGVAPRMRNGGQCVYVFHDWWSKANELWQAGRRTDGQRIEEKT